jgi:hypothetical protein
VRERAEEAEERGDCFVCRVSSLGIMGERAKERGTEGERERMYEWETSEQKEEREREEREIGDR